MTCCIREIETGKLVKEGLGSATVAHNYIRDVLSENAQDPYRFQVQSEPVLDQMIPVSSALKKQAVSVISDPSLSKPVPRTSAKKKVVKKTAKKKVVKRGPRRKRGAKE